MTEFVTALGLVFVIEGICYALFPDAMKNMMLKIQVVPPATLRYLGLAAAALGVAIVWMARG